MEYTQADFIDAINRELEKRNITYPKMLLKMAAKIENNAATKEDFRTLMNSLESQKVWLNTARLYLYGYKTLFEYIDSLLTFEELVREMNMRLRYYPIMVIRHQISKEDAEKEKAVWKAMIEYFNEKYIPSVEVKFLKTRCKIINNQ